MMAPHTYSIVSLHSFTLCGVYEEVNRPKKRLWENMEKTGFHHVPVGQSCKWLIAGANHVNYDKCEE